LNALYQEWLHHVFDHEVKEPQWYFETDAPEFKVSPVEITELISQTFRSAGEDLKVFTDAQADQGLWYLVSSSGSNFMLELKSSKVPLAKRLESIGNIFYLYSDCFAKRCADSLGHLSEAGSPLNSICYMFWDVCPIAYLDDIPEKQETQEAILAVLKRTLEINHRACREGAFHGLSEMTHACPKEVGEIIDVFLRKNKLDDKLSAYALAARDGKVL
jgi:hypothetical protein